MDNTTHPDMTSDRFAWSIDYAERPIEKGKPYEWFFRDDLMGLLKVGSSITEKEAIEKIKSCEKEVHEMTIFKRD